MPIMGEQRQGEQARDAVASPAGWRLIDRPPSLFRRFEFASYGETRVFLDRLAALSAATGLYPDLGFGTKYVNVTIYAAEGAPPGTEQTDFANSAAALAVGA